MSWIDDIIESLPREYEELARMYLPIIRRMAKEDVLNLVQCLANDSDMGAHEILVQNMTVEEIAADGDKGNELLRELNKGGAEQTSLLWHIFRMLVTISLDKL